MTRQIPPRLDHLRRLTDGRGLIHSAPGGFPDRFGGYDTIDNADALRLCAIGSNSLDASVFQSLAEIYFRYLTRARTEGGCVHHHGDARGRWTADGDDMLVQSRLARALAQVIVSELSIKTRLAAADWWRELTEQNQAIYSPRAAANWLIAFETLNAADPGRNPHRAASLANWLVEDLHHVVRSSRWDWFETHWSPEAACIPHGLWCASAMLGEDRFARVARVTTQFVIEGLFENERFLPVGDQGGWSPTTERAPFDQSPAEACSTVELLFAAQRATGSEVYGRYARLAARWFDGNNLGGVEMVDPETGGCFDALTAEGPSPDQSATAAVAHLLTHAALARANATQPRAPQPTAFFAH